MNSGGSSKQPFIALLLSFLIIGAGQFYVGDDMQKALIMFIGAIVAFFLGFVLIFPFFAVFGLWIWSMIDAYQSAGRWNVSHGFPESG